MSRFWMVEFLLMVLPLSCLDMETLLISLDRGHRRRLMGPKGLESPKYLGPGSHAVYEPPNIQLELCM